ncbi:MAG: methyl-accepting chemotaxis protein [Marinospirillum sp.]|uniref:methyl-accepting chemotaxis protein n=1 Tax=Marinospirillum sp. TaxID=2183934 RepID=UPI0019F29DEE|nr:PAS domain-containing methyl-accepting chemotaxis protein [Marinospirillum sp.]MBE0507457.1 methyl-accepting chemotaxis protein [Marinospirillum sp.]
MRNNQPVKETEYPLTERSVIISHTDAQGKITYVNDEFIQFSGFSEQELLGQPHNIIRHPDMPAEVFRDAWATLKQGRAWQGIIKNRSKDGGYYWVKANMNPDGQGGFMSVRLQASSEEIQQASQLYQQMQNGRKIRFHLGQVITPGIFPRMVRYFGNLDFPRKAMLLYLVSFLGMALAAFLEILTSSDPAPLLRLVALMGGVGTTGLLILWYLVNKQLARLQQLCHIALEIGKGNLRTETPLGKSDAIGQVFNAMQTMRNRLYEMAFQFNQSSTSLNVSADELVTSSQQTARGAQEQSEAATSMAAALEELSASVEQIGENAKAAHEASTQAGMVASSGAQAVNDSTREIASIADAVRESSEELEALNELSDQIGSIVETIRGIAEQTNLLALNAAIEAARAGDLGRGFAVVADEVRNLAERTAHSTEDITGMVHQVQERTRQALNRMREGVKRVELGVETAREASNSVANIENETNRVAQATQDIQQVLQEQSIAAREVAETIEKISSKADDNAAQSDQTKAASEQLRGISSNIESLTQQLRIY